MIKKFWLRHTNAFSSSRLPGIALALGALLVLSACSAPAASQGGVSIDGQSNSTFTTTPALTPTAPSPSATPTTLPTNGHTILVYDDAMHALLLLGDNFYLSGASQSQTWAWDGNVWTQLHPAHEPSTMDLSSVAYDPATRQIVLFGGLSILPNNKMISDTWTWDGSDWTKQHPATSPPARDSAALAYDPATQQLVLFGGGSNGPLIGGLVPPPLNDTWTWDGSDWTKQHPTTSPLPVLGPALAYDAARHNLILFGGIYANTAPLREALNTTWKWTGTNWVQLHPLTSPPLADTSQGQQVLFGEPHMVYNPQTRQIFLLLGGDDNNSSRSFQTSWVWNGQNWSKTLAGGPLDGVDQGDLVYDAGVQAILELTAKEQAASIYFDAALWKLTAETWTKLGEWGKGS